MILSRCFVCGGRSGTNERSLYKSCSTQANQHISAKKRLNVKKVFCRWRGAADGAANALIKNCTRLRKAAGFDGGKQRVVRFYRSEDRLFKQGCPYVFPLKMQAFCVEKAQRKPVFCRPRAREYAAEIKILKCVPQTA